MMQSKEIPVTYVLFPDAGRGFARAENNKAAVLQGGLLCDRSRVRFS